MPGNADDIFARLYAQLRKLGPWGSRVDLESGYEVCAPLRNSRFLARPGTWLGVARLLYGEESQIAGRWVHRIAEDLRAGRCRGPSVQAAQDAGVAGKAARLIVYRSQHVGRRRFDEYLAIPVSIIYLEGLRLCYGIGSGAVDSAHKQGGAGPVPSGRHPLERGRSAAAVGAAAAVVE